MKTSAFAFIVAGASTLCQAAPTISINVGAQSLISVGNPLQVDIFISELAGGLDGSVGAFDVSIAFDPAVLAFQSAAFGSQLDIFGLGDIQSTSLPSVNTVNLYEVSLDSPADIGAFQASSFSLGTLTFVAIGSGISPLTLTINALADAEGGSLTAIGKSSSVVVQSVPEPEAYLLLFAGMSVISLVTTRKNIVKIIHLPLV